MFWLLIHILINCCYSQQITFESESSNVEIIPNFAVVNSTSITNFTCVNHQLDDSIIDVSLSKIISPQKINISTTKINRTVTFIQLQSDKYVGIFHLLCYLNGEQSKGTRADIIVKAAPGVLQLAERCRVFDRKYIKCIIRAPTIAMAIQNDYPARFEFEEINYSTAHAAYLPRPEFLKNESTDQYLVFKWKPTVDEVFPKGIRMKIEAILSHFDPSSYSFDMTPVFHITPTFSLQAISSSKIQITFTPPNPPAFCEKTILPNLSSNMDKIWTVVEPDRPKILINNLVANSVYRVCMKCRQMYEDPYGMEKCEEIKTLAPSINRYYLGFIIFLMMLIVLIIVFVFIYCYRRRRNHGYKHIAIRIKNTPQPTNYNPYEQDVGGKVPSKTSLNSSPSTVDLVVSPEDEQNGPYIRMANIDFFKELCSEPRTLSSTNIIS